VAPIHSDWTSSSPKRISVTGTATTNNVNISCNDNTGVCLATWCDENNGFFPTYSFFTPSSGWGPAATITTTSTTIREVITSCNPTNGTFLASWRDDTTGDPTYSIFTPGSGWSASASISVSSQAFRNVSNSFDSQTSQFLANWVDSTTSFPTYSFFTTGSGWSPAAPITNSNTAVQNVFTIFNPEAGIILAAWTDQTTHNPFYSLFESGTWSPAAAISTSSTVFSSVNVSCNTTTGQFIAAWSDPNNNLFLPTYSLFNAGTGWTPIARISELAQVNFNVAVSYDSITNQYLAFWSAFPIDDPVFAVFNPGLGWGSPTIISTTSIPAQDVHAAFDIQTGQFVSVWGDSNLDNDPVYSLLTYFPPPPSSVTGKIVCHHKKPIVELTWTPPSITASITSYQITRNGTVIGSVAATGPFVFRDRKFCKKGVNVYTITSVTAFGVQSPPATVTLP
jgi:hypothetical protein